MNTTNTSDPLRTALRAAIEEEHQARAAVTAHREAIARARTLVADAEAALAKASRRVEAAKREDAKKVAAAVRGGAAARGTASAARQARAAELDARDELDAGKGALVQLQADLAELERAAAWAGNEVLRAGNHLLLSSVQSALAIGRRAKADLLAAEQICGALVFDVDPGGFPNGVDHLRATGRRTEPLAGLDDEARALFSNKASVSQSEFDEQQRVRRDWLAVRNALRRDPDAPLPELPGVCAVIDARIEEDDLDSCGVERISR